MDDEALAPLLDILDQHRRQASIAEVGGFRPPDGISSAFGGRFVALPDEPWPTIDGAPLTPLLQVRCDELPHRPPALDGIALLTIYVEPRRLDGEPPRDSGDGWEIRLYPTLEGLVPARPPAGPTVRALPVRWHLSRTEGPTWEEACALVDPEALSAWRWGDDIEDPADVPDDPDDLPDPFLERFPITDGTRVGGYATYGDAPRDDTGFVLQIASEEKARWSWGSDGGSGYVLRRDGRWLLDWER